MWEGAYLARAPELLCCRTAVRISLSTLRICSMSTGVELQVWPMGTCSTKTATFPADG